MSAGHARRPHPANEPATAGKGSGAPSGTKGLSYAPNADRLIAQSRTRPRRRHRLEKVRPMPGTDASNAKQSLFKLDTVLTRPHLIIGGLAVSHYHPTRVSKDIDLVCEHAEIADAIEAIFPSHEYFSVDANQDDLRPAYVIQSRVDNDKIFFIGPKILERVPYKYIDWTFIEQEAVPFSYQGRRCTNIVLPNVEKLTFLKILSMLDRLERNPEKGYKDLLDFVNLSNTKEFRINYFFDVLRQTECVKYIVDRMSYLKDMFDLSFLEKSSLFEAFHVLYPDPKERDERVYDRLYDISEAQVFFEKVAYFYDQRNTQLRYKAHQKTVGAIREHLVNRENKVQIVDLGCGTGKIIASSFVHQKRLCWVGVDYSENMVEQFRQNMDDNNVEFRTVVSDIVLDTPRDEISQADVILLCFVLTTCDFNSLLEHVFANASPGALLIISDIHPYYTAARPYYDFEIPEDGYISLKPHPVYPDMVEELSRKHSFVRNEYEIVYNRDKMPYSFFLSMTKI
jgi:SAM-dependent methyltransferase